MKYYKSAEFFSNFIMSSPLHKRKVPLLKTSGDDSGPNVNVCAAEENLEVEL